jgi:hypothetical protein
LWPVWEGLRPANFHEKAARIGRALRQIFAFGNPFFSSTSIRFFSTLPSSSAVQILVAVAVNDVGGYFELRPISCGS